MEQAKIWEFFQHENQLGDAFEGALPRYRFIAKKIPSGKNVLNIGVGRGGLESILIKNGVQVNCLDPSESTIDMLRKKHKLGERAKVGFCQSIPFSDNKFDFVVMSEVLEHLSDEVLNLTLDEVRRVLKNSGRFIGTVPANEKLLDNQALCPHCGLAFHRWGHQQSFSTERLRDLLLSKKFLVCKSETRSFPDWHRSGFNNFIKSLMRYLLGRRGYAISSPNIYFEAIK